MGSARARRVVPFCAVLLLILTALAPAALAAAPRESVASFERHLSKGEVKAVSLHTAGHTFHITLKDGSKAIVPFPASSQQRLVDEVEAKGLTVKIAKVPPPSHKLRYIVGAIAVVAIVLFIAGIVLLMRRRRMREEEEGPGASTFA
jgi:ATP-dependent Zn protease